MADDVRINNEPAANPTIEEFKLDVTGASFDPIVDSKFMFARDFGEYRVTPVTEDRMDRLRETAERFRDAQVSMPSDQAVLETELERFGELGLRGIILTMPDGREAFILGYENTPETFTMTMTRHDPTLPQEITAVCIHEFAKLLRPEYPLIDVEEDMGLDGLRRAKTLLSPVDLLKVYEVLI